MSELPPRPRLVPQAGPAAWRAEALSPADWMVPIGAEHVAEAEQALAALAGRAPIAAADAPLPRLGEVLRDAAARLDTGRGFVLLRGLPLDRLGAQAAALLAVLGVHVGRPLGAAEHLPAGAPRGRLRAEAADAVARFSLSASASASTSASGSAGDGPALLVAAAAVHNEVLRRDRAALEELYRPLPGGGPVFSLAAGAFAGRFDREALEAAQRLPETPRLTARQVEALDLLESVAATPGLGLRLDVRPGDLLLASPLLVWMRPAGEEAWRLPLALATARAVEGPAAPLGGTAGSGMVGG